MKPWPLPWTARSRLRGSLRWLGRSRSASVIGLTRPGKVRNPDGSGGWGHLKSASITSCSAPDELYPEQPHRRLPVLKTGGRHRAACEPPFPGPVTISSHRDTQCPRPRVAFDSARKLHGTLRRSVILQCQTAVVRSCSLSPSPLYHPGTHLRPLDRSRAARRPKASDSSPGRTPTARGRFLSSLGGSLPLTSVHPTSYLSDAESTSRSK